ncbi:MAG: hypothetical protein MUC60_02580 [Oscillatoria sp. Prado101]|jgi:hypothetical protein|nr:hypothetical protein [Oscillatoria sp. Prado101]
MSSKLNVEHLIFLGGSSMQVNRAFLAAAIPLVLVPFTVAVMFWSAWKQPAQLRASASTGTAQHASPPAMPLSQRPVSPDEPLSDTLNQRFSLQNSLSRIQQIKAALESFRRLTATAKAKLGEPALRNAGNTDPETQTLGFTNWVGSVEGTVRQQNYQIKKLEFELAQKQFQDREITQAALDQKAAAYRQAEKDFQAFLKTFRIAD